MKKFLLPLAMLCLLLTAACNSDTPPNTPAGKLHGTWVFDLDGTLDKTLAAQGVDTSNPAFAQAKEAAKTQMGAMMGNSSLTFDAAKKTISGEMMGQKEKDSPYTVKSEEGDKVVITNQGTDLPITLNSDGTISISAGGAVLVMKKK